MRTGARKTLVGNPPAAGAFTTSCRRTLRLTHSAISTIEQDKVSPAISTLQKLLKVYGLSLGILFRAGKPDEPQVVINQDDLIEMGSQGVSMKLVHNGNPNRTLAMIFETYQPAQPLGKELSIRVRK